MEWYGVGQRTISQWVTKYEIASLGANDITTEVLVELTEQAGRRYASSGRSLGTPSEIAKEGRAHKSSNSVRSDFPSWSK